MQNLWNNVKWCRHMPAILIRFVLPVGVAIRGKKWRRQIFINQMEWRMVRAQLRSTENEYIFHLLPSSFPAFSFQFSHCHDHIRAQQFEHPTRVIWINCSDKIDFRVNCSIINSKSLHIQQRSASFNTLHIHTLPVPSSKRFLTICACVFSFRASQEKNVFFFFFVIFAFSLLTSMPARKQNHRRAQIHARRTSSYNVLHTLHIVHKSTAHWLRGNL